MNLETNKDGSIEIRELEKTMHFIPKQGTELRVRMYDKFFIIDYGDVQYKLEKGKVPQMLIGTERIDENE